MGTVAKCLRRAGRREARLASGADRQWGRIAGGRISVLSWIQPAGPLGSVLATAGSLGGNVGLYQTRLLGLFRSPGGFPDPYDWEAHARAEQWPPRGEWRFWLILARRASGRRAQGGRKWASAVAVWP
jgi:hypothetical protein